MDPLSQAALGALTAQAVAQRRLGTTVILCGAVAGALPDIDVLFSLNGDFFDQLITHRGITHSLFFAPVVGPLLGWLCWRYFGRQTDHLRWWIAAMMAALWSHPALDVLTTYGTQLLMPFSNLRFAVNAMPIIDPIYTGALLVGVWWARRRCQNEFGGQHPALIWLCISSSYLGYGYYLNSVAEREAEKQLAALGVVDAEVTSYPTILQVGYRRVVARTAQQDRVGFVNSWAPCPIEWGAVTGLAADHPRVQEFLAHADGAVFEWFAMGQVHFSVEPQQNGAILRAADLRYGVNVDPSRSLFEAEASFGGADIMSPPVASRNPAALRADSIDELLAGVTADNCTRS